MAYALAKENENFIARMIRQGRFNNQSEVVREALRRMEREENAYLGPELLTETEAKRIYAPDSEQDEEEMAFATSALRSLRTARRRK